MQSIQIPSWAQLLISTLALAMSAFALFWQWRLVSRQLRHQLYQRRFDCLQVVLTFVHLRILLPVKNYKPVYLDKLSTAELVDDFCVNIGIYTTGQITELFIALQHIEFLYDANTSRFATNLIHRIEAYRALLDDAVPELNESFTVPWPIEAHLKQEHLNIIRLARNLVPNLKTQLKLYREPWWVRMQHSIDSWEEMVTSDTPDTKSPPPAN